MFCYSANMVASSSDNETGGVSVITAPSDEKVRKQREEAGSNVELYNQYKESMPDWTPSSFFELLIGIILTVTGNENLIPSVMDYENNPDAGIEALEASDGNPVGQVKPRTIDPNAPDIASNAEITYDNNKPNTAVLNQNGTLIAGNNPLDKVDPASTTKTATLATIGQLIDSGKLDASFVDKHADLIDKVMKQSNNHAAVILASEAAAAVEGRDYTPTAAQTNAMNNNPWSHAPATADSNKFVGYMNEYAQSIGLDDTSFKNPHGWPEHGHHSTAKDLAKIQHHVENDSPELTDRFMKTSQSLTGAAQFSNVGGTVHGKTGTATGYIGRRSQGASGKTKAFAGATDDGATFAVAEASVPEWDVAVKEVAGIAGNAEKFAVENVGSEQQVASQPTPENKQSARTSPTV